MWKIVAKNNGLVAGATGLEPAASAVTGQRSSNENKARFDSGVQEGGLIAPRFDSESKREIADYIADHYGLCLNDPCTCLKTGWIGRACPAWVALKAVTWDDLCVAQQAYRKAGAP